MTAIQLGPFSLGERIGHGGMGAVHCGCHRPTDTQVAIKVIRGETDDQARKRFRREVQAHAGLLHPNIVHLYEYGAVDRAAAEASDGELAAGSPFVAMELADRGTVRDLLPVDNWGSLRTLLLQILDGLAFSHARGVIHRDLKPENFLVFDPGAAAKPDEGSRVDLLRVKLADFGIAHALEAARQRHEESLSDLSGTPYYIAPEQARGDWRSYGPWTDLYALGCITWEMVCGRAPFTAGRAVALVVKHLDEERPPIDPQFAVPEELEAWIHRAMAIDPNARFQRAADAARALPTGPGRHENNRGETPRADLETADTLVDRSDSDTSRWGPTLAPTRELEPAPTVRLDTLPDSHSDDDRPRQPAATLSTGIPEDWQTGRTERLPTPLVGAGLGLFGLRETPFVDREAERNHLWEALREAEREQTTRLVLVVGESGAGKSRLVEWIATRADELGAASVLRAIHTEGCDGPAEGIAGLVRRVFNAWRLERDQLYERLLEELPPLDDEDRFREADARALTELVIPTTDDSDTAPGPRYRFSSPAQKDELVARLIQRFARRRLPLVWLDDAQWNPRLMRGIEHAVCETLEPPAGLVVLTLRAEALADDPALAERVEHLASSDDCSRIDLRPLPLDDQRRLLDRMLPLKPALADLLAERTEGNPLFATQILGEWIEHDLLEDGPDGFGRSTVADLELPDDIHELWVRRLDRAIGSLDLDAPETCWQMLELAATLGREVDTEEWRAACPPRPVDILGDLRNELVERGLAHRTEEGWSFAHGLLVDSLERRAREAGRWTCHNRRCAEALREMYAEHPARGAARRAEHLTEAGELRRALELLGEVADALVKVGDQVSRRAILEQRDALFDRAGIDEDDPRRLINDIDCASTQLFVGGDSRAIRRQLERLRSRAQAHDNGVGVLKTLRASVKANQYLGQFQRAARLGQRAVRQARASGNNRELVDTLCTVGWTELYRGHSSQAVEMFTEARQLATRHNLPFWQLHATRSLASGLVGTDETNRATRLFEQVAEAARRGGYRETEAQSLNGLGELARLEGDLQKARSYYKRALERLEELNNHEGVIVALLNLTLVELDDGNFQEANRRLEAGKRRLDSLPIDAHRHLIDLAHIACAAGLGDWESFDRRLAAYADGWPDEARLNHDHPRLLKIAADRAAETGHDERAARARDLLQELRGHLR